MNAIWTRYLPAFLRLRLEGRLDLQSVIGNTGWLFADKLLRMGLGLFVGVWLARYLGPQGFGLFNYALAFVALFSMVANLGLDSIVVRDLVHHPERRDELLGTAFSLKLVVGAGCFLLTLGTVWLIRPGASETHWMVGIIAAGTIFQALDTVDFWFQAQVRSKFSVYARNAAFLIASLLKVVLMLLKAPLIAFAWTALLEAACGAVGLVIAYRASGCSLSSWRSSWALAGGLLKESWPLLLSGVFVVILMKIDQVMLGGMRGDGEVGIFSAALRLSELWYFIPMSITNSVFPFIANARRTDSALYYRRLKELYLLMTWLSLGVALPVTFFAPQIVKFVYGTQYQPAAAVLSIHCWAAVFIFWGQVSNIWYLLEGLNRFTMYRCFLGAVVNVCLNLVLIPRYGATGAACATLATQIVASYLFDLLSKRTRILFGINTSNIVFLLPLTYKAWQRFKVPSTDPNS